MRTLPLSLTLLALAAPGAVADDTPPDLDRPSLAATLESCSPSALPAERIAVFSGSMPAVDSSARMSMRFDLERLRPGERLWRRVSGAPGFGVWERSLRHRAGFVFRKRVDGLQAPASYRVRVRFRWESANGEIVRRRQRRSALCQQPDLRPDLVPEAVTAIVDVPGLALYSVNVRNVGRSSAGPFAVRVGVGSIEVAQLPAGRRTTVVVLAPACAPGARLLVRVDADGRVEEADEHGNLMRAVCPLLMG
jgi:hypothetical protein